MEGSVEENLRNIEKALFMFTCRKRTNSWEIIGDN